jgi:deoxyribonuclease-4
MSRIGSHCSAAGGPAHAVREAVSLGLDCVQVFTANQRQWKPKDPGPAEMTAWFEALREAGWDDPEDHRTVSHNSYLVNLAHPGEAQRKRSISLQRAELERCERLGIRLCVMHPGAHLSKPRSPGEVNDLERDPNPEEREGLRRIARALDALHADLPGYRVITCLENTVGAGSPSAWPSASTPVTRSPPATAWTPRPGRQRWFRGSRATLVNATCSCST